MNIRVVRAELNNGERVVGIRYPEILIPEVEKALKEDLLLQRIHHIQTVQCISASKPVRQTLNGPHRYGRACSRQNIVYDRNVKFYYTYNGLRLESHKRIFLYIIAYVCEI